VSLQPYYEVDGITIYHGEARATMPGLPCFDALIADPPYSSGGIMRSDRVLATTTKYVNSDTYADRPEFSGDNRDQRSYLSWCSLWLTDALFRAKPGAHVLLSPIGANSRRPPMPSNVVGGCGVGWLRGGSLG